MTITRSTTNLLRVTRQKFNFQNDTTFSGTNPLVKPFLFRYHGMGYYQLLSKLSGSDDKYFLVMMGGSNDFDRIYNDREYTNLGVKDSLTLAQVAKRLNDQEANGF